MAVDPRLPTVRRGHWHTRDGLEMASRYVDKTRDDLPLSQATDLELAFAINVIDRNSLDLSTLQDAVKERLRWLSTQLALAEAKLENRP